MPSADFCPALWSPLGSLSRVAATQNRSPGVIPAAFHAQSPDLHFPFLMDMDFAKPCWLVPRWCLISGSCSSTRVFAPRFFRTLLLPSTSRCRPCVLLTLHLHQVG